MKLQLTKSNIEKSQLIWFGYIEMMLEVETEDQRNHYKTGVITTN